MHALTPLHRFDRNASALDGYGRALAAFMRPQLDPDSVNDASLDARIERTSSVTASVAPYQNAALAEDTPPPLLIRVHRARPSSRSRRASSEAADPPVLLAVLLAPVATSAELRNHGECSFVQARGACVGQALTAAAGRAAGGGGAGSFCGPDQGSGSGRCCWFVPPRRSPMCFAHGCSTRSIAA